MVIYCTIEMRFCFLDTEIEEVALQIHSILTFIKVTISMATHFPLFLIQLT